MKTVLTIAKYEILRLRSRFGGKSRVVIFPVLLLAIVLSFTIYHQDFNLSKGIYTIGIESGGPIIGDSRFVTLTLDPAEGRKKLANRSIDLYLVDDSVLMRNDERSQYAAGSLKKYLENLELNRIAQEYPVSQAFPLRIKVSYLDTPGTPAGNLAGLENAAQVADPAKLNNMADETDPPVSGGSQTQTSNGGSGEALLAGKELPSENPTSQSNGSNKYSKNEPADMPSLSFFSSAATPEIAPRFDGQIEPATAGEIQSPSPAGDALVSSQLEKWQSNGKLPEFKAEFTSENEVIVPSLMTPPMPLAQVIIAFLYVIPMFFISVFFTSSFTEEKVNRKLVILLSSPVTRLQVIFGKMLPYYVYSILVIIGVTIFLKGNILTALAIFLPVMLFVFSIYLMVALTYRTFKDQTFFSVLALSVITVYLVVPAMFAGVSDLSYVSPLTLAVQMYRGESFTLSQYLLATLPLYLIFFLAIYMGRRVFNEEFLMGFKPLKVKIMEVVYLSLDKRHTNISVFLLSILIIPVVFAFQLVAVVMVSNLPVLAILGLVMLASIVIEEIAKSIGIYALIKNQFPLTRLNLLALSALSALGFWAGEKLLLLLAANISTNSPLAALFLGSGTSNLALFLLPLVLHIVSTFVVVALSSRRSRRGYFWGIICGSLIHTAYNVAVLMTIGGLR